MEPDPKRILRECLKVASGKQGRRLRRFERELGDLAVRVADYFDDFAPLRGLLAFGAFEVQLKEALSSLGADGSQ